MAYTTIDDPSAHFQTVLYTGSDDASATKVVTNDGNSDLQPDWLWFKRRNASVNHAIQDTSRGIGNGISSSTDGAEVNDDYGVTAISSNGFSVRENAQAAGEINQGSMVCWQWKANGGTTSSNSDGDITATVQANTTAGFSIVTYTGNANGSDQTVGHGLGAECKAVFQKMRTDTGQSWRIFHESVSQSGGGNLFLNGTSGLDTGDPARIKSTNTSTFTLLAYTSPYNAVNASGKDYVAYCFAEKKGYSKIGSYIGNGNNDGTFVYTGFKPAWLLIKRTDAAEDWWLHDNKRNPINPIDKQLYANSNSAVATETSEDFVSNGFKFRNSNANWNASGGTYIYIAFAEHPFVSSKGVPVTAR